MFGPGRTGDKGTGITQGSQSPFGPTAKSRNLPRSAREQRKTNRGSAWGDGVLGKTAQFEALTLNELMVIKFLFLIVWHSLTHPSW